MRIGFSANRRLLITPTCVISLYESYLLYIYAGSALSRRIRDREREIESDERDRKKEKEEVEELRRRLQEEYPDKDPDELIAKLNKAEESGSEESPDSSPVHAAKPLVPNLSEISLPAQIIEPPSNDRPSRDRHSHDRYSRDRHSRDRHSRDRSVTPSMPPAPPATIIIKQPAMKAVPNASPAANSNNGPVFGFQMKTGKSVSYIASGISICILYTLLDIYGSNQPLSGPLSYPIIFTMFVCLFWLTYRSCSPRRRQPYN